MLVRNVIYYVPSSEEEEESSDMVSASPKTCNKKNITLLLRMWPDRHGGNNEKPAFGRNQTLALSVQLHKRRNEERQ